MHTSVPKQDLFTERTEEARAEDIADDDRIELENTFEDADNFNPQQ